MARRIWRGFISELAGAPGGIVREGAAAFDRRGLFEGVMLAVAGFLLSGAVIFSAAAPFGVAFYAVADRGRRNLPLFTASFMGYIMWSAGLPVKYLLSLILLLFIKSAALKRGLRMEGELLPAAAGAFSIVTVGGIFLWASGFPLYESILLLCEGAICLLCGSIFSRAAVRLRNLNPGERLSTQDLVSCLILFALCLLPLSAIRVGDFSLGRTLGIIIVLCCARGGNMALASMSGAIVGLTLGLNDREAMTLCAAYAVSGIMGGIFAHVSRFACAVSFVITNGIMTLYADGSPMAVIWLYEVMAASVISIIIPDSMLGFVTLLEGQVAVGERAHEDKLRELISARLRSMSEGIRDVFDTVTFVGDRLKRTNYGDITTVFDDAAAKVCKGCPLSMDCWSRGYDLTMERLNRLLPTLRRQGELSQADLFTEMGSQCKKASKLTEAINASYKSFLVHRRIAERQSVSRNMECGQFMGIAQAMERVADEFCRHVEFDCEAERRLSLFLEGRGLDILRVMVMRDGSHHVTVELEIRTAVDLRVSRGEFLERVSELCECELCEMELINNGDHWRVVLTECERLHPDYFVLSEKKENESHNGDTPLVFRAPGGRLVCLISDGMGSGKRAAIDSTMAARVVERIMTAGFDDEMAMNTLNFAMMMGGDDRATTMDVCVIDLFSGGAEFIKAGAAPSFARRGDTVYKIAAACLPAGIVENIEPQRKRLMMREGDIIVLMSDGAIKEEDEEDVMCLIKNPPPGGPAALSRKILDIAIRRDGNVRRDDMTVLALYL